MGNVEKSSLPNDSMRPLIKQIDIFSCILTVYFSCMHLSIYTRELLGYLLGISPAERNPYGGNKYQRKKKNRKEGRGKSQQWRMQQKQLPTL